MQTRFLEYFLALEREAHFARAAASCNVSQPTLSAGISALESHLGKRLIERDRRYLGLTPEGLAILPWARQTVAAAEGLSHAVEQVKGPLRGELRLGCIPAAMPAIGFMVDALRVRFPEVGVSVRALTSRQIERDLAAFELDAGLTYLDFEPPADMLSIALYTERYIVLTSQRSDISGPLSWREVADLPLCLLPPSMQNRRILDARFSAHAIAARPIVTADNYVALFSLVQHGRLYSVIPDSHAKLLDGVSWARLIDISDQADGSEIGVVVSNRSPIGHLADAVLSVARQLSGGPLPGLRDR